VKIEYQSGEQCGTTMYSCISKNHRRLLVAIGVCMTGTESASVQRPGSGDVEALSEKDQREASPLIDAFDLTLVCS